MPADAPITFAAGALAAADLNAGRNSLRWLQGNVAGSKPFARVIATGAVSLPNSADWSDLSFDSSQINRGEAVLWSSGTTFTMTATGFYLVGACCRTEPTTANKALRLYVNGTDTIVQQDNIGVSTPAYTTMNVSTLYRFESGDTMKAQVYQDSGATITAVVEGKTPNMWALWVAIDDD